MNKAKSSAIGSGAGHAATLLGRAVLGGLCGVGLVWTVTALWPPGHGYVRRFGHHIQLLARDYPIVLLGLMMGISAALLWQALRK